jgi:replication factor A1
MSAEDIVQEILSECPRTTRKEVMNAIEVKKSQSGGYLTTEAAARLVATELGVAHKPCAFLPSTKINQLIAGFNDVTIVGRVLLTQVAKTFTKPRGTGQVARLIIGDETGTVLVVMWDRKADLVEKIQSGQILKVEHGYVRLSRQGVTELHVGERTNVEIAPIIAEEEKRPPPLIEFLQTIKETRASQQQRGNLKGTVKGKQPIVTFKRRDGTEGKVLKLILEDKTGEIPVVFWNQRALEADKIEEDTALLLINAKVKRHAGSLELHVGKDTLVQVQER